MKYVLGVMVAALVSPFFGEIFIGFLDKALQHQSTYVHICYLFGALFTMALFLAGMLVGKILMWPWNALEKRRCQSVLSSRSKVLK